MRQRPAILFGLTLLMLLTAGCASVPFDYPKSDSQAVAPNDSTRLGQSLAKWNKSHPGESGFFPLEDGLDALGARLYLIERADKAIDAQYFLIKKDLAGGLFAGKLLRAADRGVRVRLLLDDVITVGLDYELSQLNSHPNIEIRMFNPISRQGVRSVNFLLDFQRANRRMHNKSFTVDNVVTIVGGRNIAEEYFQIHTDVEFADFELLGFGPVAPMVSNTFDLFWNSERAVPIEAFGEKIKKAELDKLRQAMNQEIEQAKDGVYAQAVNSSFLEDIIQGKIQPLATSSVTVVTDRPEKLEAPAHEDYQALAAELGRIIQEAKKEVIILTPYFVPGKAGVEFFREIRSKGVRVAVITNSLASTNHAMVHSGYAPYRKALLEAGIELYEVKANSVVSEDNARSGNPVRLTLHTKATIVDRKILFIGSLNVDPRSIDINTEMGVFLNSAEIASRFAKQVDKALAPFTYRMVLNDNARLEWHYEGGDQVTIQNTEPESGFWRRFSVGFYRFLPIENQL